MSDSVSMHTDEKREQPHSSSSAAQWARQQLASRRSQLQQPGGQTNERVAQLERQAARARRKRAREEAEAEAAAHQRWPSLPPAQRCFSDGLAIVFSHLTLKELVIAARSCKSWYEGAKRVKQLGAGQDVLRDPVRRSSREMDSAIDRAGIRLVALSCSPFKHHIRVLQGSEMYRSSYDGRFLDAAVAWTLADLRLLEQLPHITEINLMLIHFEHVSLRVQSEPVRIHFPLHLQSVDLHFGFWKYTAQPAVQTVLQSLGACNSLTEIKLTAMTEAPWNLAPLLQLKQLRRLTLKGWPDMQYGEEQIEVIKKISTLRSLKLLLPYAGYSFSGAFGSPWLAFLCEPPHQLQQLEELDLSRTHIRVPQIQLLQQLPALTAFEPTCVSIAALPGLAAFTQLHRLALVPDGNLEELGAAVPEDMFGERGHLRAAFLLPHLHCHNLHALILREFVFSNKEALTLCQLLPQLTALGLHHCLWPSLEPLRHLTHLTALTMWHTSLDFKLAHLQTLKSIRVLSLDIQPPLDAATVDALKPPSANMPSLTEFEYERS